MIELSKEVYVAADSSKFGKDVTVGISSLNAIHGIVTDSNIRAGFVHQFEGISTELIISKLE